MSGQFLSEVSLRRALPEDSYLRGLPAVRFLMEGNRLVFDRPVTFLVGENGTGKSTLLEALAVACGFNPEGGTRNFQFSTADTHSELGAYLSPVRRGYPKDGFFLRAESFYNAASYLEQIYEAEFATGAETPYGTRPPHCQSHGESFLALVQNRFGGDGLYLLDEPEAALSPLRLMTLLAEMDRLVKHGSQLVVATHAPILMAFPNARLYQLSEAGIAPADYRQTEHYRLTKQFLEDPERMLHYLLD